MEARDVEVAFTFSDHFAEHDFTTAVVHDLDAH
jgi:hypothetical protein